MASLHVIALRLSRLRIAPLAHERRAEQGRVTRGKDLAARPKPERKQHHLRDFVQTQENRDGPS